MTNYTYQQAIRAVTRLTDDIAELEDLGSIREYAEFEPYHDSEPFLFYNVVDRVAERFGLDKHKLQNEIEQSDYLAEAQEPRFSHPSEMLNSEANR